MDLDRLAKLIETLKDRIKRHRSRLSQGHAETRTRMALVDPLLQSLGWDTADLDMVVPEYELASAGRPERADYALLRTDGKPAVIIEAKKLGEPLDVHRNQMVSYATAKGIPYAGLTDGNRWELYDVFDRVELEKKRILDVTVTNEEPHRLAVKLLVLWRQNLLPDGAAIHDPESIFIAREKTESDMRSGSPMSGGAVPDRRTSRFSSLNVGRASTKNAWEGGRWIPIPSLRVKSGTKAPRKIKFPDGTTHDIRSWTDLIPACASWLWKYSNLEGKLPVKSGRVQYICAAEPWHMNGTPFRSSRQAEGTQVFCQVHGNAKQLLENAKKVLRACGQDLNSIMILDNPD